MGLWIGWCRRSLMAALGVLMLPLSVSAADLPALKPTAMAPIGWASTANTPTVDWRTLLGLNYRTGEVSPALQALNGKRVRVPGFMVPLEDGADGVNEFLLVPYFGACIHTPPPPPNQIVYVKMDRGRKVNIDLWNPVWIEGTLKIEKVESPYGAVGFQLVGISVSPYK
jgi:uncharacterized protein